MLLTFTACPYNKEAIPEQIHLLGGSLFLYGQCDNPGLPSCASREIKNLSIHCGHSSSYIDGKNTANLPHSVAESKIEVETPAKVP